MVDLIAAVVLGHQWNAGFTAAFSGVPILRGTYFQIYEPGWTKGYYTSMYGDKKVDSLPGGGYSLTFQTIAGTAEGKQTIVPTLTGFRTDWTLVWKGPSKVLAEVAGGILWAPALQNGSLKVDGKPTRSLKARNIPASTGIGERAFGVGSRFEFDSPVGRLDIQANTPGWTVFDARNYNQPWSEQDEVFWLGQTEVALEPGKEVRLSLEYRFTPKPTPAVSQSVVEAKAVPVSNAALPAESFPIVPKPKEVQKMAGSVPLGSKPVLRLSGSPVGAAEGFHAVLSALWEPVPGKSATVVGRVANLNLPKEGYRLTIRAKGIEVVGQDAEGLRNGLASLALLARPEKGSLVVPKCVVTDWPSAAFRGLHLFVGPDSKAFQEKLFVRAIRALKMNKVVFQCERTDWDATPGIETSMTMSKKALAERFAFVRRLGIEPIPLIQSFGHMEWLFANEKNLGLAFNKAMPYSIDPRKPEANRLLGKIWDEAIALLKPKTIHFGLDEVDMRGFPDDPELVTQLWEKQMAFLASVAKRHNVPGMLWGDMALTKDEAIDAANGHTPEHARRRRAAIPKGWLIGDWHYAGNPQVGPFRKSLQVWKREGFQPIASTWYNPDNIRSFNLAAIAEGAGTLQTTWAGYTSTEKAMLEQWPQAVGYLLSAEYAWSGRKDAVNRLGYSPDSLLRRLILDPPGRVGERKGYQLSWTPVGRTETAGGISIQPNQPIQLGSVVVEGLEDKPTSVSIAFRAEGRSLALALETAVRGKEGEGVGSIEVHTGAGKKSLTLLYGRHVRAGNDRQPLVQGHRSGSKSVVQIPLSARPTQVVKVVFTASNRHLGLHIHGVTLF